MKIGDKIYVRGYVDEIGEDGVSVIVRNDGGYFETINSEIVEMDNSAKTANIRHGKWCDYPMHQLGFPAHIYMMRQCSECEHAVDNRTPYCPWCGAKMDAERK